MSERTGPTGILASPTTRRLIRAYGPVLLVALLFLLMVLLVPTIDRSVAR